MAEISLSNATASSIMQMKNTSRLVENLSKKLDTGNEVNDPSDNPVAYFLSKEIKADTNEFDDIAKSVRLGLDTIQEAVIGLESMEEIIGQMTGILAAAEQSSDATVRSGYADQFEVLRTQITQMAEDADLNGQNFLSATGTNLTLTFNRDGTSSLAVNFLDSTAAGLGVNAATNAWADQADIDTARGEVSLASATLRARQQTFGTNRAIVQTRLDHIEKHIENGKRAYNGLVKADMNEVAALKAAAETRQQIGLTNLSSTINLDRSVINLLRA